MSIPAPFPGKAASSGHGAEPQAERARCPVCHNARTRYTDALLELEEAAAQIRAEVMEAHETEERELEAMRMEGEQEELAAE